MKFYNIALIVIAALAFASPAEARGGCGIGWHRGVGGGCYRNGGPVVVVQRPVVVAPGTAVVVAPPGRACPVGYHLGPYGHRCFRN